MTTTAPRNTILHGDCIEAMRGLPDNSVDAIVTDPPYGLGFMGKHWDSLPPGLEWAEECLRVLKPGGHLLAFGGTRTWHRLAVAVEDAGFEMRDSIAWLYGSGFPKSMDVSKAIDKAAGAEREVIGQHPNPAGNKAGGASLNMSVVGMPETADLTAPATPAAEQWEGWGTALKPAFEPIVVARKPFPGTVAANVQTHGTGALNIDGCRIGTSGGRTAHTRSSGDDRGQWAGNVATGEVTDNGGRWPANVVLDDTTAPILDAQSGNRPGFASQRHLSPAKPGSGWGNVGDGADTKAVHEGYNDSGGASRFFYVAKAPKRERPVVDGVAHETVKPLALMQWLVRLVTPPEGLVLDPFAGSGTTVEAAVLEGFDYLGIEREDRYLPLIHSRINRASEALMGALL